MALSEGGKHLPEGSRISPIQVLRVVCDLVVDVACYSSRKISLSQKFSSCVIADESCRKSDKTSEDYPRKKRKRQTGEPTTNAIDAELHELAMQKLT